MNRILNRLAILLSGLLLSVAAINANSSATMENAFKDRFDNNWSNRQHGSPGKFTTGTRTTYQGGYIRYRSEVKAAPNPVQFTPPSIKGGCNGFDVFGGSFSLISSDELLEWFSAVVDNGMNVLANYLFMTYIQESCAVCSEVMNTLYAMQDMFNSTMQDSCATSTALTEGLMTWGKSDSWQSYKEGVTRSASATRESYNNMKDSFKIKQKAESDLKAVASNGEKIDLVGGNVIFHALNPANTNLLKIFQDRFDLGATLTAPKLYAYLAGVNGIVINNVGETVGSGGTNDPKSTEIIIIDKPAFITFDSFQNPQDTINKYRGPLKCESNTSCDAPTEEDFKTVWGAELKPFHREFVCVMEGKFDGTSCGSEGGLIGKLGRAPDSEPDVTTLSEAEKSFVSKFSKLPLIPLLARYGSSQQIKSDAYSCFKQRFIYSTAYEELRFTLVQTMQAIESLNIKAGNGDAVRAKQLMKSAASLDALDKAFAAAMNGDNSTCNEAYYKEIDTFNKIYRDTVQDVR